jgi:hypothetical protein
MRQPEDFLSMASGLLADACRDLVATGGDPKQTLFVIFNTAIDPGRTMLRHAGAGHSGPVILATLPNDEAEGLGGAQLVAWVASTLATDHVRVVVVDGMKINPYVVPLRWNLPPSTGGPPN